MNYMKKLFTLLTMLVLGIVSLWAESKISKAVAGTYLFDSSNPALTVNKGGTATITTSENGAIIIHHDDLSTVTNSRTYAAVVLKVDMPTTAPSNWTQFINLQTTSGASDNSIGLGVTTAGKLKGTWKAQTGGYGPETTNAVTGEHTIVLLCNNSGTTIYVDDANTSVNNSGLKCATKWTDLRIESAYTSCIKSVYVFSGEQSSNISAFFSELSNVVTVANAETKSVSENNTATRFFVASGGTLTADAAFDMDAIEGAGDVIVAADQTIVGSVSTFATGKLTINEGKTLTIGSGQGETNSIESFSSIELAGMIKHQNSKATLNNVTVPTGKTGKIFAYDMGSEGDGFKLAGTTTLVGNLTVCNKWNFQMKIDELAGSGTWLICGTDDDAFNAEETASKEKAIINVAKATSFTGTINLNNVPTDKHPGTNFSQVTVQGDLAGCTLKKTTGDYFYYSGTKLNGTTLDGVILAGSSLINTSNTVNIKNLAGNNLNNTSKNYAFVGSGTINFWGTCDLTKKSDGTACNSANIGYGGSDYVVFKENSTVTAGIVHNSSALESNAPVTVESGATLTVNGSEHNDNKTLLISSTNLTNNGIINLNADERTSTVSALSGSGTINFASGAKITTPSVPNTMTLSGAGVVKLTNAPTSTAPTLSSWTGTVQFPDDISATDITGIFNAWGNANSTINLNNLSGYFSSTTDPVLPTLNILSGKTLTINDGYSDYPPTLSKLTGEGNINLSWTGWRDNFNLTIQKLTGFEGTLTTATAPINVEKLVVAKAPYADALLIKTSGSGTVTLNKLYENIQEITDAYEWETKTVEGVKGIYVTEFDQVALFRDWAIAAITPYSGLIGTGVGYYTIHLKGVEYNTIGEFQTAILAWEVFEDCAIPTVTLNQPTSGFYRFKAAARSKSDASKNWYMGGNADGIYSASTTDAKASDVNTIFYLEKDGNGYHPISYFSGLRSAGTAYHNVDDNSNFTLSQAIKEDDTTELLGEYKMVNGSNNTIVMWSDAYLRSLEDAQNNDWSGWTIEPVEEIPVTFKKSALGYATFFTPAPLRIPKNGSGGYDIHAYVCKMDGTKLTFYDITNVEDEVGRIIPVNTAVMLYNSTVKDGEDDEVVVNFTISSKDDVVIDNNSFRETLATVTPETLSTFDGKQHTIYSLRTKTKTDGSKVMGFYERTSTSNCAGFKAWLMTEKEAQARNFTIYFDGEEAPTGIIEALGLENDNVEIYDLNGRKLSTYKKGINIVNGKKVMVK